MKGLRKFGSLLMSLAMGISCFSAAIVVSHADAPDIRFDFTTGADGLTAISSAAVSVSNGEYVMSKDVSSDKQLYVNTPQVSLGEGGYYAYVKFKSVNGNSNDLAGGYPKVRVSANGTSGFTDFSNEETSESFKNQYGVFKFDISGQTGDQYLRFDCKQKQSTTGDVYIYIDWIVLSQSATVPAEPVVVTPAPDIRFDFTTGDDGITATSTVDASVSNGEFVMYKELTSGTQELMYINTPQVSLGEGGYYAYVKFKSVNENSTDPGSLAGGSPASPYVGVSANGTSGFTNVTYDSSASESFKNQYGVVKFDISEQTGDQYLRFNFKQKSATSGDGYIYIDWIVLSQSSTAPTGYNVALFNEVSNVVTYYDETDTYSKAFELGYVNLSEFETLFVKLGDAVKGQSLSALGLDGYDGTVMLGIIITDLPTDSAVQLGLTTQTIE